MAPVFFMGPNTTNFVNLSEKTNNFETPLAHMGR